MNKRNQRTKNKKIKRIPATEIPVSGIILNGEIPIQKASK
tara:strand:- start:63 stop:182 length:120 start_codon:yes stop_codon:yes gene_type:complete